MAQILYPLVSAAQSFTDAEKLQARTNIGALADGDLSAASAAFVDSTTTVDAWNASTKTLTPSKNIFYIGTNLTGLTFAYPASVSPADEFHFKFSVASGATLTNFNLSAITAWIGEAPNLTAGSTYDVSVQDGVGVILLVGA